MRKILSLLRAVIQSFISALNRNNHPKKPITDPVRKARIQEPEFSEAEIVKPDTFKPIDYRDLMPTHKNKNRVFKVRDILKIDTIIVHQAMSKGTLRGVANYHRTPTRNDNGLIIRNHLSNKGAPGICYHIGIEMDDDATVKWLNDWNLRVWGVRGMNGRTIHILVMGDFPGVGYAGKHNPSVNQLKNLYKTIEFVKQRFTGIGNRVFGHNKFGKLACPGYEIENTLNNIRDQINVGDF